MPSQKKKKPSKSTTTQPIRDESQVRALINYYLHRGQIRNYALITAGIYTALRISDLLSLRWVDVYDFQNKKIRKTISLTEKKTKKNKVIALHKNCTIALKRLLGTVPAPCQNQFVFENTQTSKAISRIQAHRIIRLAAQELNLETIASCHSLRKTFGYHAWKNGVSPVIIMEIYNHTSLEVTKRYLGVTQDDKDAIYMGFRFAK